MVGFFLHVILHRLLSNRLTSVAPVAPSELEDVMDGGRYE